LELEGNCRALALIFAYGRSDLASGIAARMETINHIGKCVVEGLAFFYLGGIVIGMMLIFYLVIRGMFFSPESIKDSRHQQAASMVFMMLRCLRIVWWATLISGLAWIAIAVVFRIVHG
jgi:hypothetical protein